MFLGKGLSAYYGTPSWRDGGRAPAAAGPAPLPAPLGRRGLFQQDALVYLAVPCAVGVWWLLGRTAWGLHLRAVGEDRKVAYAAGSRTALLRYQAPSWAACWPGWAGRTWPWPSPKALAGEPDRAAASSPWRW